MALREEPALAAIDYLIADRHQVLEGTEGCYSERIIRLPDGYVCYDPPSYSPPVGPLPALATGCVTFGCFNNPSKVGLDVVEVWAQILRTLPTSRLLLKYKGFDDPVVRRRFLDLFEGRGVEPTRVELEGWSPHRATLARAGLRNRMAGSPLCDGDRFARNLLAALREAWRRWCLEPTR